MPSERKIQEEDEHQQREMNQEEQRTQNRGSSITTNTTVSDAEPIAASTAIVSNSSDLGSTPEPAVEMQRPKTPRGKTKRQERMASKMAMFNDQSTEKIEQESATEQGSTCTASAEVLPTNAAIPQQPITITEPNVGRPHLSPPYQEDSTTSIDHPKAAAATVSTTRHHLHDTKLQARMKRKTAQMSNTRSEYERARLPPSSSGETTGTTMTTSMPGDGMKASSVSTIGAAGTCNRNRKGDDDDDDDDDTEQPSSSCARFHQSSNTMQLQHQQKSVDAVFQRPTIEGRDQEPGAFSAPGRGVGQIPEWARRQRRVEHQEQIQMLSLNDAEPRQGTNNRGNLFQRVRSTFSSLRDSGLVEANLVDDAEAIVYARVTEDTSKRTRRIILGVSVGSVVIIALLVGIISWQAANNDDGGSISSIRKCNEMPVEKQNITTVCWCQQSAENYYMSPDEEQFYNDKLQPDLFQLRTIPRFYLRDSCEPENQALLWVASFTKSGFTVEEALFVSPTSSSQRYILALLYITMNGEHWPRQRNWLGRGSNCDWEGVSCTYLGRASTLRLRKNMLVGTFPSILLQMPYLRKFFSSVCRILRRSYM